MNLQVALIQEGSYEELEKCFVQYNMVLP